jgi:hypothetical protein
VRYSVRFVPFTSQRMTKGTKCTLTAAEPRPHPPYKPAVDVRPHPPRGSTGNVRIAPWLVATVTALAGAGCGAGEGDEPSSARAQATPTATPEPRSTPEPPSQEVREVANRYLAAFAARKWGEVCATLVPSEQSHFDRLAGSCERAFRASGARQSRQVRKLLRNSRAGEIRIRGTRATIEITELGWREPFMRLYAIEEDGAWGISRRKRD